MPKPKDEWRPCKLCGGTRVERETGISLTPDKEIVIVNCASCGHRRGSYKRGRKEIK